MHMLARYPHIYYTVLCTPTVPTMLIHLIYNFTDMTLKIANIVKGQTTPDLIYIFRDTTHKL